MTVNELQKKFGAVCMMCGCLENGRGFHDFLGSYVIRCLVFMLVS